MVDRVKDKTGPREPRGYMKYYDMGYDPRLIRFGWEPCEECGKASELGDVVLISPRAETLCCWECVHKYERARAKRVKRGEL